MTAIKIKRRKLPKLVFSQRYIQLVQHHISELRWEKADLNIFTAFLSYLKLFVPFYPVVKYEEKESM